MSEPAGRQAPETAARPAAPIAVDDDFLEPAQVAAAYELLRPWPRVPHGLFRCDLEQVRRHRAGDDQTEELAAYFGRELAGFLLDYFAALTCVLPAEQHGPGATLEFWIASNRSVGEMVYPHMDTHSGDRLPGPERRPVLGTIFHLGPADGQRQVGTFFSTGLPVSEALLAHNRRPLPFDQALALADDWVEVAQRQNRLIRFDGRLPHFRSPVREVADPDAPRIALLANLWERLPELDARMHGVSLVTDGEFCMYRQLDQSDAEALRRLVGRFDDRELAALVGVFRRLYRK